MPRARRGYRSGSQHRPLNFAALGSMPTIKKRFDGEYSVSRIKGNERSYVCPACLQEVPAWTAHVVAWRTDSLFESGAEYRRHWHSSCWDRGLSPV